MACCCGLQKNDELEALQQVLSRVSAERDVLRHDAAATAAAGSSACGGDPERGAAGSGHGHSSSSRPCAPGAPAGPAGLRLARLATGGDGVGRGGGGSRALDAPSQPPAAAQAGAPHAQAGGSAAPPQPSLVSAFAAHALPFSFE